MSAELTTARVAYIDETRCIGCTKCIQVCPVDAIFGATSYLHTVITSECIGCNLCVPACPVDCISTVSLAAQPPAAKQVRARVQARQLRLQQAGFAAPADDKKAAIAAALARKGKTIP